MISEWLAWTCLPILFPTLVILFPTLVIFFQSMEILLPRHGIFFLGMKIFFLGMKIYFLGMKKTNNQLKKIGNLRSNILCLLWISREITSRRPRRLCAFAWEIFAHSTETHRILLRMFPRKSAPSAWDHNTPHGILCFPWILCEITSRRWLRSEFHLLNWGVGRVGLF